MPSHFAAIRSSLESLRKRFQKIDESDDRCWIAIRFEPPLPTQPASWQRSIDREPKKRSTETTESVTTPRAKQDVVPPSLRARKFKRVPIDVAYRWHPKTTDEQRLTGFCFGDEHTWTHYKSIGDDLTEVLLGMSGEDRSQLAGHDGWSVVAGVIRNRTRNDLPSGSKIIPHNKTNTWLDILYEMSVHEIGGFPPLTHRPVEHAATKSTDLTGITAGWTSPVQMKAACVAMVNALLRVVDDIGRDRKRPSGPRKDKNKTGRPQIEVDSPEGKSRIAFAKAWLESKESKVRFKNFCKDRGKSEKDGRSFLQWAKSKEHEIPPTPRRKID